MLLFRFELKKMELEHIHFFLFWPRNGQIDSSYNWCHANVNSFIFFISVLETVSPSFYFSLPLTLSRHSGTRGTHQISFIIAEQIFNFALCMHRNAKNGSYATILWPSIHAWGPLIWFISQIKYILSMPGRLAIYHLNASCLFIQHWSQYLLVCWALLFK